ncbi:MAG: type II toxin-antitoxin system HicB family antitoxin [Kiloniellales bacterium]
MTMTRMSFSWPADFIAQDDGTVLVRFPDLPEALTAGDDTDDAMAEARDCLRTAIAGRMLDRGEIPVPSPRRRGQRLVSLDPLVAAKAALYLALARSGMTKVALAARLGCDEKEVRRLLDPRQRSRLDRIVAALYSLGAALHVRLDAA